MANREQLRDELIEYARKGIEKGENDPVFIEDEATERRCTLAWQDGVPTLIHRLSVENVFPHEMKEYMANYCANVSKIAPPNVTYQDLGEDGGCKVVWQRIDPQVIMISARSLMVTAYSKTEDDEEIFVLSTKGNEHLIAQHKDKLGSDVNADLYVNAMFFKPKKDSCDDVCGTDIVQIYAMNPNGSLPGMVVDKLIKKQADGLVMFTDAIKASKQ